MLIAVLREDEQEATLTAVCREYTIQKPRGHKATGLE